MPKKENGFRVFKSQSGLVWAHHSSGAGTLNSPTSLLFYWRFGVGAPLKWYGLTKLPDFQKKKKLNGAGAPNLLSVSRFCSKLVRAHLIRGVGAPYLLPKKTHLVCLVRKHLFGVRTHQTDCPAKFRLPT